MTIFRIDRYRIYIMAVGFALAVVVGAAYLLIDLDILAVGDLRPSEQPAGIIYIAAGCYLAGGLLILANRRWLWIFGAIMNALVILFFFLMYLNRREVIFSPGGSITKAAQIYLELILIYLIINWRNTKRANV